MEYGGKAFPDAVEELARDAGLKCRASSAPANPSGASRPTISPP